MLALVTIVERLRALEVLQTTVTMGRGRQAEVLLRAWQVLEGLLEAVMVASHHLITKKV